MSIYNKIIELSIIAVLVVSLVFNILFPLSVLAKEIGRNDILVFNFSDHTIVKSFALAKEEISTVDSVIIGDYATKAKQEEKQKAIMLPFMLPIDSSRTVAPVVKKDSKIQLVLAETEPEQTNDEIADKICKDAGIIDLPCWQDLKAMRMKESFDGKEMTGDGGRSRGWYHIQIKMHGITDACALDFECSTEWTVKNLIAHNYTTNRLYAISKHNGGGKMAQAYARNVVYNSAKFE